MSGNGRYVACIDSFDDIPGAPISAYVASDSLSKIYKKGKTINELGEVRIGMGTGDNDLFLKLWWEINNNLIDFSIQDVKELNNTRKKYFPYSKGGERKRWYGNHEFVVWFDAVGRMKMADTSGHRENGGYEKYFHKGMTWSYSTMAAFCARIMPYGFVFDVNGSSLFLNEDRYNYVLAFLQSSVGRFIIDSTKSAFSIQAGTIRNLPIIGRTNDEIERLVNECIEISKRDWDYFETSWDFSTLQLVKRAFHSRIGNVNTKLSSIYEEVAKEFYLQKRKLIEREQRINELFIDAYELNEEVTASVSEGDLTLHDADVTRDIKGLISYAVGCMFGRYSLDVEGLAYAGGDWKESYATKYNTFIPDEDGIIPITDEEYFKDDIVARFVDFIRIVYGERHWKRT